MHAVLGARVHLVHARRQGPVLNRNQLARSCFASACEIQLAVSKCRCCGIAEYCAGSRTMPVHAVGAAAHDAEATRENSTEASTDPHPRGEAALMAFLVRSASLNVKDHSV